MKRSIVTVIGVAILLAPVVAQETGKGESSWTRERTDRAERGKLHDAAQQVRGDSGKWNDEPKLQVVPSLAKKPPRVSLDDWCDQIQESDFQPTGGEEVGLVFRSRQLDDNDRMWIARIERRGNRFEIVACEAVWQGRYSKNFTWYNVLAVKLGKLEPGRYEAKWTIKPLAFKKFDRPGPLAEAWPQDEQPAEEKPVELSVAFTVDAAAP